MCDLFQPRALQAIVQAETQKLDERVGAELLQPIAPAKWEAVLPTAVDA